MTDKPPTDPAEHAEDFSRRYAEDLEIVAGQAMMDLGIPNSQMGERDHTRRSQIHSFFPSDRQGGTVSHAGQVTLDSGLMNPDLLKDGYDEHAQQAWQPDSHPRPRSSDHCPRTRRARIWRGSRTGAHRRAGDEVADQPPSEGFAQEDGFWLAEPLAHSRAASVRR